MGDCGNACANWQTNAYHIDGWDIVVDGDVDPRADLSALKSALYTKGPLAVQMKVYEDFQYYGGGIYSYISGEYINTHFVLLVGWDDLKGAFKCKNSYGTNWGENGFFWISYNELYGTGPVEFGRFVVAIENVILTNPSLDWAGSHWGVGIIDADLQNYREETIV